MMEIIAGAWFLCQKSDLAQREREREIAAIHSAVTPSFIQLTEGGL